MSFSFGFSADDISEDETSPSNTQNHEVQFQDPLESFQVEDANNLPKELSLDQVLESLVGNRFTFNQIDIQGITIFRRELFDIKHQLMMEDESSSEEFQILIGETQEDLKNQVYEGGLKSWECSIDAVEYLSRGQKELFNEERNFIELGCGTSLPSIYLFLQKLKSQTSETSSNFILTDFNKSVLRLVTIPNLLINWAKTLSQDQIVSLQRASNDQIPIVDDELEITVALVALFKQSLALNKINFRFISGSWCSQFLQVLNLGNLLPNLIISSETIYSPSILPIISELILKILKSSSNSIALVTAKDIYFGVGGSVNEFIRYLDQRQSQGVDLKVDVMKLNSNLKRSIIIIE